MNVTTPRTSFTIRTTIVLSLAFLYFYSTAFAQASMLKTVKVQDNIYALVGPLDNRTPENLGNNATFGFIITDSGIVLIDPGGTYKGAAAIHTAIKAVSKKPIKFVINTGAQDHRWLGNSYFKQLGATIIASEAAVADQKLRRQDLFIRLGNLVGDKGLVGTNPTYADKVFDKRYDLNLGGMKIKIYFAGQAHTPGDSFVWLPEQKIVFSGDVIYTERMLSLMTSSSSRGWIKAFQLIAEKSPRIIVPGHGTVTDMSKAKTQTLNYLLFLRKTVSKFMDADGGIEDVGKLDQSQFRHLKNYESLKGRNIQRIYEEMEFE